jgi:alpha-tubulin suppressor-like RCC1 family protein
MFDARNDLVCVVSSANELACDRRLTTSTSRIPGVVAAASGPLNDLLTVAVMADGSATYPYSPSARSLYEPVNELVQVTVGHTTICGIKTDGAVWCWGTGYLGDGQGRHKDNDVQAPGHLALPLPASSIALGLAYGCALLKDSSVWCWGDSGFGISLNEARSPEMVPISDVKMLAIGSLHVLALRKDGTLWCWGSNYTGQCAQSKVGLSDGWLAPRKIDALGDAVDTVSAGSDHSCAVKKDGTVWCWGLSSSGQAGSTDPINNTPRKIRGCR